MKQINLNLIEKLFILEGTEKTRFVCEFKKGSYRVPYIFLTEKEFNHYKKMISENGK